MHPARFSDAPEPDIGPPASLSPGPGFHGPGQGCEHARIAHLGDVEAQEPAGRLGDAVDIPGGEDHHVVPAALCNVRRIHSLRQAAPQIEAATRHKPRDDAQPREPLRRIDPGVGQAMAHLVHVVAIAASAEDAGDELARDRADRSEAGGDLKVGQGLDPLRPRRDVSAADGRREGFREAPDADHPAEAVEDGQARGGGRLEIGEDAGERPQPAFWLFSCIGAATVAGFAMSRSAEGALAGDLLMIAAVIVCGLGYAEGATLSRRLGGWQVISWALLLALPLMAAIALAVRPGHLSGIGLPAWMSLGYVSVFSMLIGFVFWYRGLALGGIAGVGQLQLMQPFLGLAFSAAGARRNHRLAHAGGKRHRHHLRCRSQALCRTMTTGCTYRLDSSAGRRGKPCCHMGEPKKAPP